VSDEDLFDADRCSWLNGVSLSETIFWDTSRHYQHHLANLKSLTQVARKD
jgi:hypothetical protein